MTVHLVSDCGDQYTGSTKTKFQSRKVCTERVCIKKKYKSKP